MPYQNADSGDAVVVVIALVAMVIFILMLFTALVIVRSEGKTKNEAGSEKEHRSGWTAGGHASLFSQDKPKGELKADQRVIVEQLKTLNWGACCIIAAFVAFSGYDRLQHFLLPVFQIPAYYYWSANILAIISPICMAVAWLRFTGVTWQRALRLFLFVPMGVFVLWFITNILPHAFGN